MATCVAAASWAALLGSLRIEGTSQEDSTSGTLAPQPREQGSSDSTRKPQAGRAGHQRAPQQPPGSAHTNLQGLPSAQHLLLPIQGVNCTSPHHTDQGSPDQQQRDEEPTATAPGDKEEQDGVLEKGKSSELGPVPGKAGSRRWREGDGEAAGGKEWHSTSGVSIRWRVRI
ncbi:hypothetical protein P7K49_022318 [Saguinus oedipus]|uniref:Uncharacterized protein n=1 Tax=Saguinus oedipus TaxID=9490 RepID=A0ABQ9UV76_SAGOE|nr:hypothetical protein P7K49_022318 [Saguinus oedipus]